MAASVIVDASYLVALLSRSEADHDWAVHQARISPPPWQTCEAALSETFHLLGPRAGWTLAELLRRGAVVSTFSFQGDAEAILRAMRKYVDVPMSFADACLVRMTEILPDPTLLTTDLDFRVYRRHSRQTIPCVTPR
jgi:predicted nucleic acid-binding protein